jgi:hypothetical protein
MTIKSNVIDQAHLNQIADQMDLLIYQLALTAKGMRFVLRPRRGSNRYRRINHPALTHKSHQRNLWAVCWHGFRDFMIKVYELDPNATIITTMATYHGQDHFNQTFEETGNHHVNGWSQVTYRQTCAFEKGD